MELSKSAQPYMKGVALELPFLKLKYLRVQGYGPKATSDNNIAPAPSENYTNNKQLYAPALDTLTPPPQIITMGPDPMKSRLSVLHELEYGRMKVDTAYNPGSVSAYQNMAPALIPSHVVDTYA